MKADGLRAAALVAAMCALVVAGCGGSKRDAGGFNAADRQTAQDALATLLPTSATTIITDTTLSKGLPLCRLHRESAKPVRYALVALWVPSGAYAAGAGGTTYAWLRLGLTENGPNVHSWKLRYTQSLDLVKRVFDKARAKPSAQCRILTNGELQVVPASPEADARAEALLSGPVPTTGITPAAKRRAAPVFILPRVGARGRLALKSLRGKAVVLNFWSAGCTSCRSQAEELEHVWRGLRARGLVVVGINEFDFAADARRFVQRSGITYPVVRDGGLAGQHYGVQSFPETFIVDRQGRLVDHIFGPASAEVLNARIRPALAR